MAPPDRDDQEKKTIIFYIKSEMSLILECKEKKKLTDFYETNHFKQFGRRKLDRDETDIKGGYLLQYFAIL
jgi:hypothetical protein